MKERMYPWIPEYYYRKDPMDSWFKWSIVLMLVATLIPIAIFVLNVLGKLPN